MLEVKPFSKRDRTFHECALRFRKRDWDIEEEASRIVRTVYEGGAAALCGMYSVPDADSLRATESEIESARKEVSEQFLTAVSLARVNIRKFHEDQRRRSSIYDDSDGVRVTRQIRALDRVGVCCGASFSSLLMHAVPAQMAGVRSLVVSAIPGSDGRIDPRILAIAKLLEIDEVYKISGAAAVAAMAFGPSPLSGPVDKIVGNDGRQSQAAKRAVSGITGVDVDRGLGDLLVVADESANAKFIAGDLLAQAEHADERSFLGLFSNDRFLAEAVRIEVERLADRLPNSDRIRSVMIRSGMNYVFPSISAAIEAANTLAPARISLQTKADDEYLTDVETAGAVFLGTWSVEASGDCFAGINPYLPIGGQARFASGLGLDEFTRELPVAEYSPDRFLKTGRHLAILAEEEGLPAHANAVRERLELLKLTVD